MAIDIVWDDAARSIIRWDFEGEWSWDEFQLGFDRSLEMASSVSHRVDVIPYTANSDRIPPGALTQFKRVYDRLPDNAHLVVITGGNAFGNAIIRLFSTIYRISSWHTAKTLEEARTIIVQDRERI